MVYVSADNIISPLAKTSSINFEKILRGDSSVRKISDSKILSEPFYASMFLQEERDTVFSRFEKLCIASITEALSKTEVKLSSSETLFILSTTKGNIELLENAEVCEKLRSNISLSATAKKIASHFSAVHEPLVISNACISGVLAIICAKRLLDAGIYKHAVIVGADVISKFIVSGFKSLSAISAEPCKPFDKSRNGINLGECASTIILTSVKSLSKKITVGEGAASNDANHISGPSRTGWELSYAMQKTLKQNKISANEISFISAHGTATLFNDEMEAKAFSHSGLSAIPVHSLKGNFGHTLGAAGILESILSCQSLLNGTILPSKNFETLGVSEVVNVNTSAKKSNKQHALKTASGFGGCNAAITFSLE